MFTGVAVESRTTYVAENFLLTREAHKAVTDPSTGPSTVCTLAGYCAKLTVTPFVNGKAVTGNAKAGGRKQVKAKTVVTLKLDGGATGAFGTVRLTGKDARLASSKCRKTIDRDLADMVLSVSGITGTYARVIGDGGKRSWRSPYQANTFSE